MMRWARYVTRMGMRNAYEIFVVQHEDKRPFARRRRRLEDNIKTYLSAWWRNFVNIVTDFRDV
jgi:hypothetical protein